MIYYVLLCNKHCNGTFEICLLMCATIPGAHMSLLCILFYSSNMGVTVYNWTIFIKYKQKCYSVDFPKFDQFWWA